MTVTGIIAQLRTTDIEASIRFYTETLGFELAFRYEDFYAGIRAGTQMFHLKHVDEPDPSIAYVVRDEHFHLYFTTSDVAALARQLSARGVTFVQGLHVTPWGMQEFAIRDDQGHTFYFGQNERESAG
jgi:catechol 2,3-dioxygenase-like lactoylglutathione lyase family enzyme